MGIGLTTNIVLVALAKEWIVGAIKTLAIALSKTLISFYSIVLDVVIDLLTFAPTDLPYNAFSLLSLMQYGVSVIGLLGVPIFAYIQYTETGVNVFETDQFMPGCLLYIIAVIGALGVFRFDIFVYDIVVSLFSVEYPTAFTGSALRATIETASPAWVIVYTVLLIPSVLGIVALFNFSAIRIAILSLGIVFTPVLFGLQIVSLPDSFEAQIARIKRISIKGGIGIVGTNAYFAVSSALVSALSAHTVLPTLLFLVYPVFILGCVRGMILLIDKMMETQPFRQPKSPSDI